jgi:hypothetical protein
LWTSYPGFCYVFFLILSTCSHPLRTTLNLSGFRVCDWMRYICGKFECQGAIVQGLFVEGSPGTNSTIPIHCHLWSPPNPSSTTLDIFISDHHQSSVISSQSIVLLSRYACKQKVADCCGTFSSLQKDNCPRHRTFSRPELECQPEVPRRGTTLTQRIQLCCGQENELICVQLDASFEIPCRFSCWQFAPLSDPINKASPQFCGEKIGSSSDGRKKLGRSSLSE